MQLRSLHLSGFVSALLLALAARGAAASFPSAVLGTWRIDRILPTTNDSCWKPERARPLVGTTLTYGTRAMVWQGGTVPLQGVTTRTVTEAEFRRENPGTQTPADFAQLGIHAAQVTEVDLQHEDMDITGASTEVPGDAVLLAAPNRIVVSACGVYMEASRKPAARARR